MESTQPVVELVNCFSRPFDNAVAAARTCYSARGIVTPPQVAGDGLDGDKGDRRRARRDALAVDIFQAGHHTTFQHAHLQFTLDRVSRQFVWTFLHAHPFYNSEQVSQRYVEVKDDAFYVPPLDGPMRQAYVDVARFQMDAYRELETSLAPLVEAEYFRLFPARRKRPERWLGSMQKKCMEVARYVLPIATLTRLYHTVSAVTLLRYHRLAESMDAPYEQRQVVGRMVELLLAFDPDYAKVVEEPLPLEQTLEYECLAAQQQAAMPRNGFAEAFDRELDGLTSKLVSRKVDNEALLAASVREVLGVPASSLGDEAAIDLVLDPGRNKYLAESLNLTSLGKLTRCLVHPSYTFRRKLSHTADSQDQRHRMTPASRPCLSAYLGNEPDVVLPALVAADDRLRARFDEIMAGTWERIGRLRARGLSDEFAAYLLPNAVAIRFSESADLAGLRHKHEMRLCYNAQEEIWRASLDEARQIAAVEPRIGRHLLPPCTLRLNAGTTPICPEGKRYCGVRVWDLPTSQYERLI